MSIAMQISGFLFLLIVFLLVLSDILGHGVISDLNSEVKLQKINQSPQKFKISFILLTFENIIIILLAVTLFIAFSSYSLVLGISWLIVRVGESLIQAYDKRNYWGLFKLAKQYSEAQNADKTELVNLGRIKLKTKITNFAYAQILFSIGTILYSSLFVAYEAIPIFIGWFGIVTGIIYGIGNALKLVKPNFEALWKFGALLVLIFELGLGIYLLFYPLFT
jgi:hypothetical protein